jgi:hypothetical protein
MTLFVEPRQSPTSGGDNYAGAKYYFYLTGTTTPAAIYTDAALTTQHANPVIADSGGVFAPIWLNPLLVYRRLLKSSAGAQLSDVDPYPGAVLTQTEIATLLWPQTPAELSAGITPTNYAYLEGNPRRYGAVGDGVANDTTPVLNAMAVVKQTYNNASLAAAWWNLHPGDQYMVTSPLHFGSTTASGLRIKFFSGNGAKFICNHAGIGVDLTNFESGIIRDLRVTNGTEIPKILVLECRFADSTSQGMRNKIYNLEISGRASICGLFNYGSETNSHYSPRILMDTGTPFGHVISDTGRYWDGAAFVDVKPSMPNMSASDPVLPGVSTTNNGFLDYWNNNTTTYANGGRAALQFVGSGKHVFNGTAFMNTEDTAVKPVMSVSDTGVGGGNPHGIRMPNWNPHAPNDICWEHVSGGITGLYLDNVQLNIPTTADFKLTAGTITDSVIHGHKIVLLGNANGNNQFRVDTSFSNNSTTEGHIYLGDGATISLTGNNAQNRCKIHDGDNNRTYAGWDLLNTASVSTVGTGEDNLQTYSITGSTALMGAAGRKMIVRAAGTKTGGAGNKTLKFYIGATSWTFHVAANNTNAWALEVDIYTTGSATQTVFIKAYEAGALTYAAQVSSTEDLVVTKTMKITGECANGADAITQTLWVVEME